MNLASDNPLSDLQAAHNCSTGRRFSGRMPLSTLEVAFLMFSNSFCRFSIKASVSAFLPRHGDAPGDLIVPRGDVRSFAIGQVALGEVSGELTALWRRGLMLILGNWKFLEAKSFPPHFKSFLWTPFSIKAHRNARGGHNGAGISSGVRPRFRSGSIAPRFKIDLPSYSLVSFPDMFVHAGYRPQLICSVPRDSATTVMSFLIKRTRKRLNRT